MELHFAEGKHLRFRVVYLGMDRIDLRQGSWTAIITHKRRPGWHLHRYDREPKLLQRCHRTALFRIPLSVGVLMLVLASYPEAGLA